MELFCNKYFFNTFIYKITSNIKESIFATVKSDASLSRASGTTKGQKSLIAVRHGKRALDKSSLLMPLGSFGFCKK